MNKTLEFEISGLGIIIFSPFAVSNLEEEEDYLSSNYMDDISVLEHIKKGTIVGFSTSSPGRFILKIHEGYPSNEVVLAAEYKLRLGVEVRDRKLCFSDLYDLMDWSVDLADRPQIEIDDGFYHITLFGNRPPSGVLGDNQEIHVYLQRLKEMPELSYGGIPSFCGD